jgi:thymidylate synthase (FAD)
MAQATRHRHLSFSVQSQRYTGDRVVKLAHRICNKAKGDRLDEQTLNAINEIFYLRPFGTYQDRQGCNYNYDTSKWQSDINIVIRGCLDYLEKIERGYSTEHARDFLPQNIRQDFVVTFNARSLLHFCDLRLPKDAQLEIRTLAQMLFEQFKQWMPSVAEFYEKNRYEKNKLSP